MMIELALEFKALKSELRDVSDDEFIRHGLTLQASKDI